MTKHDLWKAIREARNNLALMLPSPSEYSPDQWPVTNPADGEALCAAFDALETALYEYEPTEAEQGLIPIPDGYAEP